MLCFSGVGKPEDVNLDGEQETSTEPAAPSNIVPSQPSNSAIAREVDAPARPENSKALQAVSSAAPTGPISRA